MKTSKQREEAFRRDWEDLLKKHKAETEIDHETGGLDIMMFSVWANDTDVIPLEEYAEFTL